MNVISNEMEVLGKSKSLLTFMGFCLSKEQSSLFKIRSHAMNVLVVLFLSFDAIATSITYMLDHLDDISLVLQALYQIFACVSVAGLFCTFAPQKYLVYEIFTDLKRMVDGSK